MHHVRFKNDVLMVMLHVMRVFLILPPSLKAFLVSYIGTVHNMRQIINLRLIYKTKYNHE